MSAAGAANAAVARPADDRLPLQPLLDALPLDPTLARRDVPGPGLIAQAAALLPITVRSLYRYRHNGLDPWTADRLAISAGLHPFTVWGEDWTRTIAVPDTTELWVDSSSL